MERKRVAIGASLLLVAVFLVAGYVVYPAGLPEDIRPSEATGTTTSEAATKDTDGAEFVEVAAEVGIKYEARNAYDPDTDQTTNAGVYTVDYDNNGWNDILAVGGEQPVLFQNEGGEFGRSQALPDIDRDIQAALFFDYDNDGWDDLLLLSLHRQPLFLENHGGTFERKEVGLDRRLTMPTGASAADYDGDGCLDLFIIQTGNWTTSPPDGLTGRSYGVTPGDDNGNLNRLYRGNCSGFTDVTNETGIQGPHWSLATSFVDFTRDGYPDIHVANDFHRDTIYINQANGTFERRPMGRLLERNETHLLGPNTNRNAMSSEVGDVNGDGWLDLYVTNIFFPPELADRTYDSELESQGNNLFLGSENGSFHERSGGYSASEGGWGWAAGLVDLDDDRDQDLIHTTMTVSLQAGPGLSYQEIQDIYRKYPYHKYPAVFPRSDQGFVSLNASKFGFEKSDGRGLVVFDFDHDGDRDIVIADASGSFKLYENRGNNGNTLQISVRGTDDTPATGAVVSVTAGNETHRRVRNVKADFLSQDSRTLHFGLSDSERVEVRVNWPDGSERVFTDVSTGQRLVVTPTGIRSRTSFQGDVETENKSAPVIESAD